MSRTLSSLVFAVTALWVLALSKAQGASVARTQIPICGADSLSLNTDGLNGAFNNMSHSGTLVVLRNLGSTVCRMEQYPIVTFEDANGRPLNIHVKARNLRGMHPGPVLVPFILVPNAELTSSLCWISGPVFEHSTCLEPSQLSINIGGTSIKTKLDGHLCGDDKDDVTFSQTPLLRDPVYKPAPRKVPNMAPTSKADPQSAPASH